MRCYIECNSVLKIDKETFTMLTSSECLKIHAWVNLAKRKEAMED